MNKIISQIEKLKMKVMILHTKESLEEFIKLEKEDAELPF